LAHPESHVLFTLQEIQFPVMQEILVDGVNNTDAPKKHLLEMCQPTGK
jgi:hypothetical protein